MQLGMVRIDRTAQLQARFGDQRIKYKNYQTHHGCRRREIIHLYFVLSLRSPSLWCVRNGAQLPLTDPAHVDQGSIKRLRRSIHISLFPPRQATMNRWQKGKLYARKFVAWTPADVFCSICPVSSDVYAIFRRKIQRSNLRLLFTSIMLTGVLLDVLAILYLLQPYWEIDRTNANFTRLTMFTFLSCLNIAHHLFFLLLRIKTDYTAKHQLLISTASFFILIFLISQFQFIAHPHAPVQVWITLGLLQMLVVVFYYQGSFVSSMVFWVVTIIWISSGDSVSVTLQVFEFLNLTCSKHFVLYRSPQCKV